LRRHARILPRAERERTIFRVDIDLPLAGTPAIECRTGGPNGDHTLVFTFLKTLTKRLLLVERWALSACSRKPSELSVGRFLPVYLVPRFCRSQFSSDGPDPTSAIGSGKPPLSVPR